MLEDGNADRNDGPGRALFDATRWSIVLRAREKSESALAALCETYRRPLLTWLRIQGYAPEQAEDAVQGFFAHILSRAFLENVAREKGSFRTFLLRCLKNYLRDEYHRQTAAKRGGTHAPLSLDETDGEGQKVREPAANGAAPDREFDRAWAKAVIANALIRLEAEYASQGNSALCAELKPAMSVDDNAPSYAQIASRLGMSEGAVKVAAHRMRNRLATIIRNEVSQTVANESDLEEEVRYLIQLFAN